MTLVDQTNEKIDLSLELPGGLTLGLDIDSDSSIHHEPWIWLDVMNREYDDVEEHSWRVNLAEAGLMHDRLGLLLGRPPTTAASQDEVDDLVHIYQREWEKKEVEPPVDASPREQLDSQFRFRLARRILLDGYRKAFSK
jgi:hypothetical protein